MEQVVANSLSYRSPHLFKYEKKLNTWVMMNILSWQYDDNEDKYVNKYNYMFDKDISPINI